MVSFVSVQRSSDRAMSPSSPTIVHSRLDTERVSDLVSPQPQQWRRCRVLKQDAGTTVILMADANQSVIVKHHQLNRWRRRADALIHGSPARRAWSGAQLLQTHGFPVPEPLVVLETLSGGMVRESVYVSAALPYPPLSEYWQESASRWPIQQRRLFLRALAGFVRSFHAAGLYSGDLRDANLLVQEKVEQGGQQWQFCLVDLDRIKHDAGLNQRRRIKNLVQLDRTLGRRAQRTERLFFLYQYLGTPLPSPRQRRELLQKILLLRRQKDHEYAKRRAKRRRAGLPAHGQSASEQMSPAGPDTPSLPIGPSRRPISCCIVCFNEELNIRRCLESVKWCDEIIVVDSFSTDKTAEICRDYPTRIIQRPWPGYVEQKRFALSQASHDWVLNVDADEEVALPLQNEIQAVLQRDDPAVDGFYIPRLVRYLGRWWWHGWYPGYRLRLFRKHKVRWGGVNPHEKALLRGSVDRLGGNLHHYTYDDISDHLQTINGLTDVSSRELVLRKRQKSVIELLFHPLWRFFSFYFLRGCVRDGIPGFFISITSAFYVFLKYAKLREHSSLGEQSPPMEQDAIQRPPHDPPATRTSR